MFRNVDLREVARYIDWAPFFQAWELSGAYPAILSDDVVGEAARNVLAEGKAMLADIVAGRWLTANGAVVLMPANSVDTRGKPLDHIAFSTGDIDATLQRIKGQGIEPVEELSFKPDFGFRSFMLKSPQGVGIEIVQDTPFKP